jgi:hypothetical protein
MNTLYGFPENHLNIVERGKHFSFENCVYARIPPKT